MTAKQMLKALQFEISELNVTEKLIKVDDIDTLTALRFDSKPSPVLLAWLQKRFTHGVSLISEKAVIINPRSYVS